VSFSVEPGELTALIGPNGAGKSILLRILAGLLLPSEGIARVAQLDVVRDRPRSRKVIGAALSEDRGLSPRLTVQQNLEFYSALYGLSSKQSTQRIRDLAERFEASALLAREVRTLSTGERARAVLIRVLLHRPRVVLLDEITRSLEPGAASRLRRQILAITAFYFLAKLIGPAPLLGRYGADYFSFVLLGLAIASCLRTLQATFAQRRRESQVDGSLEVLLGAPLSTSRIVGYLAVYPVLAAILKASGLVLLGAVAFGARLKINALGFGATLLFAALPFGALGLFSAAVVLIFK